MKPETFFDNFEVLADAPNGVQKLRELILKLAVQGKLLLQNDSDEPVEILLEKIKIEKRTKIKKSETLPTITPKDIGFKLPKQWSVEYLGNIAHTITKGATPTTYGFQFQSEGIRFVKVETVKKGRILKENITEFISPEAHEAQSRSKLESDDILFSIAGTIGETCIVQKEDLPANTNQALAIIRGTKTVFRPDFLKLQLDSFVANAIKSRARGGAMYNISLGDLKEMIVFIPPLAEQLRIVAKVDQLMSLCDELEARQQKKRETRAHLNSAALDRLLAARAPGEFADGWRRISDNFDLLYDAPENVGKLRQAILQLAVMGKLVEQDERDEPAPLMLKRIKAEKESLVKGGEIRKGRTLTPIKEEEIPYMLPKEWQWVRLEDIVSLLGDGLHGTPKYTDSGDCFFINGNNLIDGKILIKNNTKRVSIDEYNRYKKKLDDRTVLVSINGTLGNVAFYNNEKVILGKSACYFNLLHNINKFYLKLLINTSYFLEYAFKNATGSTIKNVSLDSMRLFLVPLPPFNEQARIVTRVDQLMSLCDKLEAGLMRSQADSEKLMEAVVGRMLAGGDGVEEHGGE